jgi:hypothetical protein
MKIIDIEENNDLDESYKTPPVPHNYYNSNNEQDQNHKDSGSKQVKSKDYSPVV